MDFLNKPVSEMWKTTKRTLAEIMDSNEGVRNPGTSTQRNPYDQEVHGKRDSKPSGSSSQSPNTERKPRSSFSFVKGRHRSLEGNLNADVHVTERENRPMDCNPSLRTEIDGIQRNTSNDSLDFAEVQKTPAQSVMPKIKSKDKQSSDRDRTKTAWTKFRLGYLGKTSTSTEVDDTDSADNKSPILPSLMDKSSPSYTSSSSVGSPGKTKSATRASRRSRGDIGTKGFDFRSRFRSNSSDRATMRRREREERERTRRSSYSRSTSFDANEEVEDDPNTASDETEDDQSEKVKTKLLSMWNNVKYGWTMKTKTNFSIHRPIWFLGKCYHQRPEDPDPERPPGLDSVRSMVIEMFKQDFSSRLWMTYRREFPTLAGSNFTSDCGWGCMLRSGQMMLAHSLILHFLGREWNVYKSQTQEMLQFHRQIVRWFGDQPLDMSPFSVHRLVGIGQSNGKKVGDWYGPSSVAHILKEAVDSADELNPLLGEVCIYVAQDCTVYKKDVIDLCRSKSKKRLQPVFRDVPSSTEGNSPVKCTTNPMKGQAHIPGVQHEHLQGSSPNVTKELRQSTSSLENGTRVGTRLAHSHERVLSMYSGPGRSERSSGSSTNGFGSQSNVTSTSCLGDSPSPHGSNTHRPGSRDIPAQEHSTSLPARTGVGLYPELPKTNGDERLSMEDGLDSSTGGNPKEGDDDRTKDSAQRNVEMKDVSDVSNTEDEEVFGSSKGESRTRPPSDLDTNSPFSHHLTSDNSSRSDASPEDHFPNIPPHFHQDRSDPHSKDNIGSSSGDAFGTDAGEPPIQSSRSRTSTSTEGDKPWCAVIILIPVRLGGDEVNPVYIRPIQSLFTLESCLGIIGGKPKHSLYFVGFQEEKLIHLDPHYCQQVVDMKTRDFPLWSFHCMSPRKMSMSKMDPSCTIGFYIRTEEQFEQLCQELPTVVSPLGSHASDYPMFIVRDGRCGDWQNKNTNTNRPERYLRVRHVDENGQLIAPVKESEDFVLLDS